MLWNVASLRKRFSRRPLFTRPPLVTPGVGWSVPTHPTDDEVARIIRSVPDHRASATYIVYNSALATTAAPVSQPTGTAVRTMMQLKFATGYQARVISWGFSFDGSAAATPGKVELVETGAVFATVTTAFAAADVQPYGRTDAVANTAGTSGVPLNLGTSASGFASASGTEGSITTTRMADLQLAPPTQPYVRDWPLGREFDVTAQNALRVRVTFGTTVNFICWVVFEI